MKKLMIAEHSEVFGSTLVQTLQGRYELLTCYDGRQALAALPQFRPDILIINLMLPHIDGISVLQQTEFRPGIILATTPYMSAYVEKSVMHLGVDFTLICPSPEALLRRLQNLLDAYAPGPDCLDPESLVLHHLQLLNIPTHLDGFRQLCTALPLFIHDPGQLLGKELYPRVAELCGCRDGRSVEHSIRKAIHDGWKHRDNAIWRKYFPMGKCGNLPCPSNKEFLCRLAELITDGGVL